MFQTHHLFLYPVVGFHGFGVVLIGKVGSAVAVCYGKIPPRVVDIGGIAGSVDAVYAHNIPLQVLLVDVTLDFPGTVPGIQAAEPDGTAGGVIDIRRIF